MSYIKRERRVVAELQPVRRAADPGTIVEDLAPGPEAASTVLLLGRKSCTGISLATYDFSGVAERYAGVGQRRASIERERVLPQAARHRRPDCPRVPSSVRLALPAGAPALTTGEYYHTGSCQMAGAKPNS